MTFFAISASKKLLCNISNGLGMIPKTKTGRNRSEF